MIEVWKDVVGYEGIYRVSSNGNIKSLNYMGHGFSQILIPKKNNQNRLWVALRKNGKIKYMLIHRIVASAFIPNPNNFPQINHKDENPQNNKVENLEWCTQSYNIQYSNKLHPDRVEKLISLSKAINNPRNINGKPVTDYRRIAQLSIDNEVVKLWFNANQIKHELCINEGNVRLCCDGKRKTAYGYKWQYVT